jgi:thioredoxin 1
MIAPTLEEIAGERPDSRVGKVNVDENPELAKKFRIISIPTLIVLEKGQVLDKAIGARPKEEILELLEI